MYNIVVIFLLFVFYSVLGWLVEVTVVGIETKKFVNRGFLIGPYCPIYGSGSVLIILLLRKYVDDPLVIFTLAAVICSILEYLTSYMMEKMFKARWWDYSHKKFNLNGRICLSNMIAFGVLGTLMMYFINPTVMAILESMPEMVLYIIAGIIALLMLVDLSISFNVISRVKTFAFEARKDNTVEITARVKEMLNQQGILLKRLASAYPNFISTIKSKRQELEERKDAFIKKVKTDIKNKELEIKSEIERFKIKK